MATARQAKTDAGSARAPRSRDLQINEDVRFQTRDWIAQRIGWGLLAALLLAGLLGLFGDGPLSRTTRTDGHGLTVEYERYVRHSSPTTITLSISAAASGRTRVTLDRAYLLAHDLQRVLPEPDRTMVDGDRVTFVYETPPQTVRLRLEPDALGRHVTAVQLDDGPPVAITQFTYP
jgi:hypothetical protein